MDDASILDTVARATRLREGPAGVAAVLRAVYRAGSLRLQDAAREARLPLPVTTAIRRELEKAGLLERKHGLSLTDEGRTFVEKVLGFGVSHYLLCPTCAGRGVIISARLVPEVERLEAIISRAPSVDVTLDQSPCTPQTAILRAVLMLQHGDLEGRKILILGDDDSLSIAIGLVRRALVQGEPTHGVVVIESDARRVSFLREAAREEKIAVEVIEHDLREPLPPQLRRAFDVTATDPSYTLAGAKLFLARAAEALPGEHQFRGLAARDAAKPHYRCRVALARWAPRSDGAGVNFTIEADRFLHRMVRFLVGVMVDIALGRRPLSDLPRLLGATDNQAAGPPAPPQGLYLEAVRYPPDLYAED